MFGSFENLFFLFKSPSYHCSQTTGTPELHLPQISKVKFIVNKTFFGQMHDRNVCIKLGSLKSLQFNCLNLRP